jgi:hypothetical protein
MVRGIGDGYYPYPISVDVELLEVASTPEELTIRIASPAEVYRVASLLRTENIFCHDSFSRMRV